jgi:hypothetical protein
LFAERFQLGKQRLRFRVIGPQVRILGLRFEIGDLLG